MNQSTAFSLSVRPAVAAALRDRRPVVALESSLIAQGLPWPVNLETARAAEAAVREVGAEPATIAVLAGEPMIGLTAEDIAALAQMGGVSKASRRDLAAAIALGRHAATTVSATMALANLAGIHVMATGGIGGVHRSAGALAWDISADLTELSQTPVAVICAGAKSILDIPRTLEMLETLSVPIVGYGCDEFPGFYVRSTGQAVSARVDRAEAAARLIDTHWRLGGKGVVIAQPVGEESALSQAELDAALPEAERQAARARVHGAALTPFLLARLAELTGGKSLRANQDLVVANARLAAQIARLLKPPQ